MSNSEEDKSGGMMGEVGNYTLSHQRFGKTKITMSIAVLATQKNGSMFWKTPVELKYEEKGVEGETDVCQ